MTDLFDANVLVALSLADHVHHDPAHAWLTSRGATRFATCPLTQGALLRIAMQFGASTEEARSLVTGIGAAAGHEFWPDDVSYVDVSLAGVIGHRQVTDAYLAQLARSRSGRLVTLDAGLATLHSDVTDLVPTG